MDEEWVENHRQDHKKLEVEVVEHRAKIDGIIEKTDGIIQELAKIKPKPTPIWQLIFGASSILVTVLSVVWALSGFISERPTMTEIQSMIKTHSETSHPSSQMKLDMLEKQQFDTARILERISTVQEQMKADLFDIKSDIKALRHK